jgi:hypothetical protein
MRWIHVSTPFVRSSSGCYNIDQIGAPSSRIRAFLTPLPPPLLNCNQNFLKYEFQTSWCAESRCHLHLSIAPLVVALQWRSAPIFEDSEHFCSPTPRQLWTTIRTSWKMNSRPFWCVESRCHLYFSIALLVGCCATIKVGIDSSRRSRVFSFTHTTTALNYNQDFLEYGF